jgi:hypothetical protein
MVFLLLLQPFIEIKTRGKIKWYTFYEISKNFIKFFTKISLFTQLEGMYLNDIQQFFISILYLVFARSFLIKAQFKINESRFSVKNILLFGKLGYYNY